jgi:hypothetical protein
MTEQDRTICELCFDYFAGECTIEEQQAFENHLPNCRACESELADLRITWEAISEEMERMEPPADLKKQVMDAVTGTKKPFYRPWLAAAAAAAGFAMLIISLIWNDSFTGSQTTAVIPIERALAVSAAKIEQLIPLSPVSYTAESGAYGVACIINNGENKQFIVYVFGAQETLGEQAYQVWLTDDGERRSAGTFRVNNQGVGVMAMPIDSDSLTFNAISISLEPDDQGSEPRGKKVFGSEV